MVRSSCFNSPIHFHKPKKPEQPSMNSMHKAELNYSQNQDLKDSNSFSNTESKSVKDYHFNNNSSINPSGKSVLKVEALDGHLGGLKKSQSQGSMLDLGATVSDPHKIDTMSEACHLSSYLESNESVFSICDQRESDKEADQIHYSPNVESTNGSVKQIAKSPSMPNFGSASSSSEQFALKGNSIQQSRSYEDLKDMFTHDVDSRETGEQARDDFVFKTEGDNVEVEDVLDENYDYYSGITKDWIIPTASDLQSQSCVVGRSDELPGQDFKVKRIEEWVSGLQHCSPPEETNDFLIPVDQVKGDSSITTGRPSGKDTKTTAGAEFAKRYLSSLSAASAAAQLANHGLVVIPLLGAFVSLKVLNLSGNSIEKITAGSLPRGLHVLNLSKNKISVIEGLRELNRLRVIDLSYNRIVRIGHGLSSCSSLKELYLAGNKISEVEGLHRLLKLTVLDLRFNKISTAKCLGQLAANYTSLQAISVEGNPAQKNVGDDQLKKYLQSLLPHLAYFNRQDMKANTSKDIADRSVRLGISGSQIERGLRQDHKVSRKSVHALSSHKGSSTHGHHRSQAASPSPVRSKPRHGRLPPTSGTKVNAIINKSQYLDFSRRIQELKLESSMRRSRSEGTLGVF